MIQSTNSMKLKTSTRPNLTTNRQTSKPTRGRTLKPTDKHQTRGSIRFELQTTKRNSCIRKKLFVSCIQKNFKHLGLRWDLCYSENNCHMVFRTKGTIVFRKNFLSASCTGTSFCQLSVFEGGHRRPQLYFKCALGLECPYFTGKFIFLAITEGVFTVSAFFHHLVYLEGQEQFMF